MCVCVCVCVCVCKEYLAVKLKCLALEHAKMSQISSLDTTSLRSGDCSPPDYNDLSNQADRSRVCHCSKAAKRNYEFVTFLVY